MKLKTYLLTGLLMFSIPCGVALAEEVSAPDPPPAIEQPAEPEPMPPSPDIVDEAREGGDSIPDGSLKPNQPESASAFISQERLVLESVSGVPDTLRVYLTIRGNVISDIKGSQILNTTYFDSVDKAEIKIRLEGEGRLNGARFNFIPVGMPELPPLPPVLPEEEEPIDEEPSEEVTEPVEEPIDEVTEPSEEPVEEPTEEVTEELETTTPESGDPATEPTYSDPVGEGTGDAGEAVESDTGNTGEPSGEDISGESTGDSGESADTTESGDTTSGESNGSDSTGGDTGESSGESGE